MSQTNTSETKAKAKPIALAIDDEIDNLETLQRLLRNEFELYLAQSGPDALSILESLERVDVMIVDQRMPKMAGTEFLKIVNETVNYAKDIVKILLTAYAEPEDVIASINVGKIDYYYRKPFVPSELKETILQLLAQKSKEKRAAMRLPLSAVNDVKVAIGDRTSGSVKNLCENGMFLKTYTFLRQGTKVPFTLSLPDGTTHTIYGKIARSDLSRQGVGIEFLNIEPQTKSAIAHFLSTHITLNDLAELKKKYPFLNTEEMVAITDSNKIQQAFEKVLNDKTETGILHSHSRTSVPMKLSHLVHTDHMVFSGKQLDIEFMTSEPIFVSFTIDYTTYNFETIISKISDDGTSIECLYPKLMFYCEQRAILRQSLPKDLKIEIPLPGPFDKNLVGKVVDLSDWGAGFLVPKNGPTLLPHTPLEIVRILDGDKIIREDRAEVRNINQITDNTDEFRVGIQFGIGRKSIRISEVPSFQVSTKTETTTSDAKNEGTSPFNIHQIVSSKPNVVRYENANGEEIVALLNTSIPLGHGLKHEPVPVVIIPPAFGKTKETLFALALSCVATFSERQKPVVVIRYDGIRRKGESYKEEEISQPPYEMVNACLSQGAHDITATLDWVDNNPHFRPQSVTLVSFSLSALETRLVLRNDKYRQRINYWISCVGTPELRYLLTRVNCGLDLVEQHQLGMQMGVIPVLGNLVNIDKYMADSLENRIATIDQARADMALVDIPVTWIYGEHDHWVKQEFIRDVMAIDAKAPREVISLPLGHNARTSEEALKLFGTIASLIYRFLHDDRVRAIIPDQNALGLIRRSEIERIPKRNLVDRQAYWKRYLVGEEKLIGFDVLTLADDYQDFMADQAKSLALSPDDSFLDLGGGTGNFLEFLLGIQSVWPKQVTLADLVESALTQAEDKITSALKKVSPMTQFQTQCVDIELNRYLPMQRFIHGEFRGLEDLIAKIENLSADSVHKIKGQYSQSLHQILRGDTVVDAALEKNLKRQFDLKEVRSILDLNLAARYIRKMTASPPTYRLLKFSPNLEENACLPFGNSSFDKILMSLVLSYVHNPLETLFELKRIIKPGGRLVLSTLYPDADASGLFTRLVGKVSSMDEKALPHQWSKELILNSIRSFLNDAQALVDLEEAGTFEFFRQEVLKDLLAQSGFKVLDILDSFGNPAQGYIVIATRGEE